MAETTAPSAVHVACAHCGAVNRMPAERLGEDPSCGKCGQALLDGKPVELGDGDFDRVVKATDLPVVVDFWAPWCGPCRQMAPQFESAAAQMKGRALFVKVNSDNAPQIAGRYGIRSIPTLVKLQRGKEVGRHSGAMPAQSVVRFTTG